MSENQPGPEFGPEAKFNAQLLLQWFVFPMLVVVLCVGLYFSFHFLTAESKTTNDYLNDLKSGNPHRAWQAAFSLANQVNLDRIPDAEKPAVGRHILDMLEQSSPGAGQIRQYFILILGRLKYDAAVPKLIELVKAPDASEKIYALFALREMAAMPAVDAAAAELQDEDAGVRKTAAYFFGALGRTGRPDLAHLLTPLLNDPVPDVRWNAAFSLSEFHDSAAIPVLLRLLDRAALSEELKSPVGLDETNVEKIIKAALTASLRFRDPSLETAVQRLASSDPMPNIQTAARQTLERMGKAI